METQIILAIIAIVAVPLTSWITSKLLKREYKAKISKLEIEVDALRSGNDSVKVDNTQKLIDLIMHQVVEPLKKELNGVRKELSKFRKAVERIPDCDYADTCPVKRELREQENNPTADSNTK